MRGSLYQQEIPAGVLTVNHLSINNNYPRGVVFLLLVEKICFILNRYFF